MRALPVRLMGSASMYARRAACSARASSSAAAAACDEIHQGFSIGSLQFIRDFNRVLTIH